MQIIFSKHAVERLIKRKLTQLEIIESIKSPDNINKKHDMYYYQKKLDNKKIDDLTIIDLDDKDNILGIELLKVSKRIPLQSLSEVNVKNLLAIAK